MGYISVVSSDVLKFDYLGLVYEAFFGSTCDDVLCYSGCLKSGSF